MTAPARRRRLTSLLRVALRHRLDLCLPLANIDQPTARLLLKTLRKVLPTPDTGNGERLRAALLELGPVYIKFGQLLSTRLDLLDDDTARALATLQDDVGPIADFDIHQYVEAALGQPWQDVFTDIETEPLATASIAQVHGARLLDDSTVVIKIVRPGIEQQINADMQLLARVAQTIDTNVSDVGRLHLPQLVADHHQVLLTELDMFHEARNQIQLRRNFAESDLLYVPRVISSLTREQMLVMERVYAVSIRDVATMKAQGVDLKLLADKGVRTFFTQVFEHNFFHADMHPGNIFVDITEPANPRYIALDCAIIGTLSPTDQQFLAHSLLAFFNRDFSGVAQLFIDGGWVPADTDQQEFERVITQVCEPIFEKPLSEISFAEFVVVLMRTAADYEMDLQPQLALLQKTLLYVEGVGRQLYPELDLWQTAKPFMERWAQEQFNPFARITDWLLKGLDQSNVPSEQKWRSLATSMAVQQRSVTRIEQTLRREQRRSRRQRAVGATLVAASLVLLWQPLSTMLMGGDVSLLAGMAGVLLGSALVVRA